jgi:hypothetical protein
LNLLLQSSKQINELINSSIPENYAGVFICKEEEGVHYQFISFWSRKSVLDEQFVTSLNAAIAEYPSIDTSYLKVVKQDNCEVSQ